MGRKENYLELLIRCWEHKNNKLEASQKLKTMASYQNGCWFPEVISAQGHSERIERFRTREQKIDDFLQLDLERFCQRRNVRPGDVLYIAPSLEGLEISVNGSGLAKRKVKANPNSSIKGQVYMAKSFLIQFNQVSGRYYARLILDNDGWLRLAKVEKAFKKVCAEKDWLPETMTGVSLTKIYMPEDGFRSVAWTARVEDEAGIPHVMACLIANGLIIPDLDAEVTSMEYSPKMFRVAECAFRQEFGENGLSGLNRP